MPEEDHAIFSIYILVVLLAYGMTKRNPHDRAVEDKKALVGCQQKEVQTYLDTHHE